MAYAVCPGRGGIPPCPPAVRGVASKTHCGPRGPREGKHICREVRSAGWSGFSGAGGLIVVANVQFHGENAGRSAETGPCSRASVLGTRPASREPEWGQEKQAFHRRLKRDDPDVGGCAGRGLTWGAGGETPSAYLGPVTEWVNNRK